VRFRKYQGLGNDYIVLERDDLPGLGLTDAGLTEADAVVPGLPTALVQRICDRHFGVGSDGILVEDDAPEPGQIALRILNPDGSEAEKSGNGLRIFSRYLWDEGRVGEEPFSVVTRGGTVRCQVRHAGRTVFVEMGTARFDSQLVPVLGPRREVVGEEIEAGGERLRVTAVTMGNPHCVVHVDEVTAELARRLGPALENHRLFPTRTNVQFCRVLGPRRIQIEIWERGAGYTLASGSSSCAAAAASVRLGYCSPGDVTVVMPGGTLEIVVGEDYAMTMLGPVGKVMEGTIADEVVGEAG
jgi:diaminopimelate epimerase